MRQLKAQEAMADEIHRHVGTLAFHRPPPLEEATVAVVTTAGLRTAGQQGWGDQDQSFRVLPGADRDLRLAHRSANFDRTGMVADINVVLPVDRLAELASDDVIGGVAPRHLSFMGALRGNLETIRLDSGPRAAALLHEDGVDVVLLTPV